MKKQEKLLRIILVVLAFAVLAVPSVYVSITGNYFSEISSNLIVSVSDLLLICALLIGINRNPKSKPSKIGAISGLTILLLLRWF